MSAVRSLWNNQQSRILFFAGLTICLLTAVFNIGIIALDDYDFVISQIIPAQLSDFGKIATGYEIRSPVHPLFLAAIGKAALTFGIDAPTHQLRFILFSLTLLTFSLNAVYGSGLFEKPHQKNIFLFLLGFYFVSPLFLSRPLIETMASPFIMMAAYYSTSYWKDGRRSALALATAALVIASIFRFQAGVCAIAVLLIALLKKDFKGLATLFAVGVFGVLLTGVIDFALTGRFHGALINYVTYNIRYGAEHYGTQPVYTFPLLFLALSIPPTLIQSYRSFSWTENYRNLVPAFLFFLIFVIAHTIAPHKEERFMVPILPVFLAVLAPLFSFTLEKGWRHWRVGYFLTVNFLLLPLTSFSTPQHNSVGLVQYVDQHPFVKRILGIDSTLVVFPMAYSSRPIEAQEIKLTENKLQLAKDCSEVVAVREDLLEQSLHLVQNLTQVSFFAPGILEKILVYTNPTHNYRRDGIALFASPECSQRF